MEWMEGSKIGHGTLAKEESEKNSRNWIHFFMERTEGSRMGQGDFCKEGGVLGCLGF